MGRESLEVGKARRGSRSNHDFTVTLKARYVTGIILASCMSVNYLMSEEYLFEITFYPADIVFASAVELLGRCINGNESDRKITKDLNTGFQWLADPGIDKYQSVQEDHILVKTSLEYSIKTLIAIRHFSAHGQAVKKHEIDDRDYLILEKLPPLIGNGMQAYLTELTSNETLGICLARAEIEPYRSRPIVESRGNQIDVFRDDMELYPASIGNFLRNKLDWSCKRPPLLFGDI